MLIVSFYSLDFQDLKFQYLNRKAYGTSFLNWGDFTKEISNLFGQKSVSQKDIIVFLECLE